MKKQKKTIKDEIRNLPAVNYNLYIGSGKDACDNCLEFEEAIEQILNLFRQTLQRFMKETIGEMYRNAVLSDKYPDLAKESKIKFEAKQEIEEKMKQWLEENL